MTRHRNKGAEYKSHKKWINSNKDDVNEYYRNYYEEHKEHMRELANLRQRKYRSNRDNKIKEAAQQKLSRSTIEYKESSKIKRRVRYENNKEYEKSQSKINSNKLRLDLINHYTSDDPKCKLCGNTNIEFLEIDHTNNDGGDHRKDVGGGRQMWLWIKKNNYPDGFNILCRNCNIKKFKLLSPALSLTATKQQVQNYNYYNKKRLTVINYYSDGTNICKCCGEVDVNVLCIDHINGGGNEHRRSINDRSLIQTLFKMNFPDKEKYRVLCENCNASYGRYGYCPHNSPTPISIHPHSEPNKNNESEQSPE